jgi:hypothetical protein
MFAAKSLIPDKSSDQTTYPLVLTQPLLELENFLYYYFEFLKAKRAGGITGRVVVNQMLLIVEVERHTLRSFS